MYSLIKTRSEIFSSNGNNSQKSVILSSDNDIENREDGDTIGINIYSTNIISQVLVVFLLQTKTNLSYLL